MCIVYCRYLRTFDTCGPIWCEAQVVVHYCNNIFKTIKIMSYHARMYQTKLHHMTPTVEHNHDQQYMKIIHIDNSYATYVVSSCNFRMVV